MKQLKHKGREPASGMRVIEELFKRGDIVSADTLKPPTADTPTRSAYSLGGLRATLGSYLWGSKKPATLSLDDPIVPVAALKAAAARASSLAGPMASADIHTVKTFATAITAFNTRDAEAVIAHIISQGEAVALFTDATKDNPNPVLGVKLGKAVANEADKGVLKTKAALENMEQMLAHLETQIAAEKEAATVSARAGNKIDALARLRKKKVLEAKLIGARSAAQKLADVLMAVDEAESNKEAIQALETGMSSLKAVTEGGVTAERVDLVAADLKELMDGQTDVRLAFEQLGQETVGEDALLEQELENLVSGKENANPVVGEDVVKTGVNLGTEGTKTLADEAEEELAALLASMPTPSEAMPSPGKAASNAAGVEATVETPTRTGKIAVPEL